MDLKNLEANGSWSPYFLYILTQPLAHHSLPKETPPVWMPCNRTGVEQLVNVHHVLQRRLQKQFAGQGEASVGQLESLQMIVQMCNLSNIRK